MLRLLVTELLNYSKTSTTVIRRNERTRVNPMGILMLSEFLIALVMLTLMTNNWKIEYIMIIVGLASNVDQPDIGSISIIPAEQECLDGEIISFPFHGTTPVCMQYTGDWKNEYCENEIVDATYEYEMQPLHESNFYDFKDTHNDNTISKFCIKYVNEGERSPQSFIYHGHQFIPQYDSSEDIDDLRTVSVALFEV